MHYGTLRDLSFQNAADFVDDGNIFGTVDPDSCPPARQQFNQAFGFQHPECLAYRRAAGACPLCDFEFLQPFPWCINTPQDGGADELHRAFIGRGCHWPNLL